jgi:hypothetical protein
LRVRDWHTATGTREIQVSGDFYAIVDTGRVLVFHERAGRFNMPWARLVGAK